MNCDHYITLINGHLDGVNTFAEEESLQEHLKTCEACRVLLSTMEHNEALLRAQKAEPPAELTAKIMQQVRKNPKKKKKTAFYTSLAASGLAAAAMLGLVISGNVKPPEKESEPIATVQNRSMDLAVANEPMEEIDDTEMHMDFADSPVPGDPEEPGAAGGVDVPKKTTHSVAVLLIHTDPSEISLEGEVLDPQNLPSCVENAGYPSTGEELAAFTVTWAELQRIFEEYGETYDVSLYRNPEATYKQGIIIFVD